MGIEAGRMHPKAQIVIPTSEIRQNVQEILSVNEKQEKQLQQYSTVTEELRAENKEMRKRLEKLEVYENLSEDTAKYWTCYIRNPIVIQKLRARIIQLYGVAGDTAHPSKGMRSTATRLLDGVVEECVRYGTSTQWHIIKRNLEEQRNVDKQAGAEVGNI